MKSTAERRPRLGIALLTLLLLLTLFPVLGTGRAGASADSDDENTRYLQAERAYLRLHHPTTSSTREEWLALLESLDASRAAHPSGPRTDDALALSARMSLEMYDRFKDARDLDGARARMRELVEAHPGSPYSESARADLKRIEETARTKPLDSAGQPAAAERRVVAENAATVSQPAAAPAPPPVRPETAKAAAPLPRDMAWNQASSATVPPMGDGAPRAEGGGGIARILNVKPISSPAYTRVVIEATSDVKYTVHRLPPEPESGRPPRLYLDISGAKMTPGLKDPVPIRDGLLEKIRVGQYDANTVRVVLDIQRITSFRTFPMRDPSRIILDVKDDVSEASSPSAAAEASAKGPVEAAAEPHPLAEVDASPAELARARTSGQTLAPPAQEPPSQVLKVPLSAPVVTPEPAPLVVRGPSPGPPAPPGQAGGSSPASQPTPGAPSAPQTPPASEPPVREPVAPQPPAAPSQEPMRGSSALVHPPAAVSPTANPAASPVMTPSPTPPPAAKPPDVSKTEDRGPQTAPSPEERMASQGPAAGQPEGQPAATPKPPDAAPTAGEPGPHSPGEGDVARAGAGTIEGQTPGEKTVRPQEEPPPEKPSAVPTPAVGEPSPNATPGQKSLASIAKEPEAAGPQRPGPKIRRIVIDPGHGGKDSGAKGEDGIEEKNIVLEIAKGLADLMRSELRCEVILTREDDTFLELAERTAIANNSSADLFVSVHANAHRSPRASGIETYFLNFATDPEAMEVAARENATSTRKVTELQMILEDLMRNSKINESSRLASFVQGEMIRGTRKNWSDIKDHGVKQAPFFVLVGAEMPSILLETSFITNRVEEQRLRDPRYQNALAQAIVRGVRRYVQMVESAGGGSVAPPAVIIR